MRSGNADNKELVNFLLGPGDGRSSEVIDIDKFIESGNLALAERKLRDIPTDRGDYVIEKSDDRLIHYMAGYVACKFVTRHDWIQYRNALLQAPNERRQDSQFTEICDKGGLLYPSRELSWRISSQLSSASKSCAVTA